ncbi:MAG TPA: SPFH domain-containing protein [Candidatus Obscuribacterales bacterium]
MLDLVFSIWFIPLLIGVLWFLGGIYMLSPQESALLMRFGKPVGSKDKPGLYWRPLGIVSKTTISTAIQEFPFKEVVFTKQEVEVASSSATPTGDAAVEPATLTKQTALAAVTVEGVVQYSVMEGLENLVKARFKLQDPKAMIKQRFQNALRGTMNVRTMWDALSDKDKAASEVQEDLTHVTVEFGHTINNISITNVTPDNKIVESNNAMIASVADMQTRANKGRGEQLETVAIAKGRADAMIENGRGIAGQRDAVARGMQAAVSQLKSAIPNAKPEDLMAMVMYTVYTDMMNRLAAEGQSKVIFVDNSPNAPSNVLTQLRQAIVSGNEASAPVTAPEKGSAQAS